MEFFNCSIASLFLCLLLFTSSNALALTGDEVLCNFILDDGVPIMQNLRKGPEFKTDSLLAMKTFQVIKAAVMVSTPENDQFVRELIDLVIARIKYDQNFKKYAAQFYSELAHLEEKRGEILLAITAFKKAVRYNSKIDTYLLELAQDYYHAAQSFPESRLEYLINAYYYFFYAVNIWKLTDFKVSVDSIRDLVAVRSILLNVYEINTLRALEWVIPEKKQTRTRRNDLAEQKAVLSLVKNLKHPALLNKEIIDEYFDPVFMRVTTLIQNRLRGLRDRDRNKILQEQLLPIAQGYVRLFPQGAIAASMRKIAEKYSP